MDGAGPVIRRAGTLINEHYLNRLAVDRPDSGHGLSLRRNTIDYRNERIYNEESKYDAIVYTSTDKHNIYSNLICYSSFIYFVCNFRLC